ncbi:MAG: hypothetical protein ACRDNG_01665 [Gaiellaceae bacterium]
MSNLFEEMNEETPVINEKGNKKNKEKININNNGNIKSKVIENDNENVNYSVNNEVNENVSEIKTTRFVESLLQKKTAQEEKVLVGFRLDQSVGETIDTIVKKNRLKKSEFVNDLLRKALGL